MTAPQEVINLPFRALDWDIDNKQGYTEVTVGEWMTYVSDRKDATVRLGAQQVITREVEALELNARQSTCFDVAMQSPYMNGFPVPTTTPARRVAIQSLVCKLLDARGQDP